MNKGVFVPELPCEGLVKQICGSQWRTLTGRELDGALGVAIVRSVLDGVPPELNRVSSYLGVDRDILLTAFRSLSMNGVFRRASMFKDEGLHRGDDLAWCYYAGYASGATGLAGMDDGRQGSEKQVCGQGA